MNGFSSYSFSEGKTGIGQQISFTYPLGEDAKKIKEFIAEKIRSFDLPIAHKTNVDHGSFGRYSRYEIIQHKYAGGHGGYIELLEIKNPPDNRHNIVIHFYTDSDNSSFSEWETIKDATYAFQRYFAWDQKEEIDKFPGFKRWIKCGALTPWFYAIGDEELIGDYAVASGLEDDPVFRLNKSFVVFDDEGFPAIKTCMGTRFIEKEHQDFDSKKKKEYFRLVFWDDGSCWDEHCQRFHNYSLPRPAESEELWITEAIAEFKKALAGKKTDFTINFTNGEQFIGKIKTAAKKQFCAEGDYFLTVSLEGEKEQRKGWLTNFTPTAEYPDVIQYVTAKYKEKGCKVVQIKIEKSKTKKGGKKWAGTFFSKTGSSDFLK